MSLKNRDEHNRWRNKTVAFRVSPEEWEQIERYVQLSGLPSRTISQGDLLTKKWSFKVIREYTRLCVIILQMYLRNYRGLKTAVKSMTNYLT